MQSKKTDVAFGTDVGKTNFGSSEPEVEFVDDSNGLAGSDSNNYPQNVLVDADSDETGGTTATYDVKITIDNTADDISAQNEFGIAVGDAQVTDTLDN